METNEKLHNLRHSLAHLLAAAVLELWPETKVTIGPVIENGFYYDFDFKSPISDKDLPKIEKKMRELLKTWKEFTVEEKTFAEAKKYFADNEYKTELIDGLKDKNEKITFYTSGNFTDLCRGGHLENPSKEIKPDAFKLDRVAGAYWRGDEKNKMLTRIYGLAFETKKGLEEYLKMREEAEKRDHRKLGKELELFTFDEEIGKGLPIWLPKGNIIKEELENWAKETEEKWGYKRVTTPIITKENLFYTSGHLPLYKQSMYSPIQIEDENYYIKPMNCPFHHKVFSSSPKSYKDLPYRIAEYGWCHRFEDSGSLFGLMRVRGMQMNDAHIYCTPEQFAEEFQAVNQMYIKYFRLFGIKKYVMRFSTHNPAKLGEKYVNEPELWQQTEDMVRNVLKSAKIPYLETADEAAFYGPKIDVEVWSAIGREFSIATNQVDFAVPKRFGLSYTTADGKSATPLCIHRAPLSTHERLIGFLLEHYAGILPFWLAPVQAVVLPVSDKSNTYAQTVADQLVQKGYRVNSDNRDESLGRKIRDAELQKIPYMLVVGEKEMLASTVTIRALHAEEQSTKTIPDTIKLFRKQRSPLK